MLLSQIGCQILGTIGSEYKGVVSAIPAKMASITDFKVGSYWIYKNDSLNAYDTISVITNNKSHTSQVWDSDSLYIYFLNIQLSNSYGKGEIDDALDGYDDWHRTSIKQQDTINLPDFTLSVTAFRGGDTLIGNSPYSVVLQKGQIVRGRQYDTIYRITNTSNSEEYVFAPLLGLVQMTRNNQDSKMAWYLISSKIN
jgi:hypothetical protein